MNTTKTHLIRATAISAAIALGVCSAMVSAGAADSQFVSNGVNQYVVRFADLDLTKVDGAAALYGRLRHAAGIVCTSLQSKDLTIDAMHRTCVDHAIAAAIFRVDSPMLSQYSASRSQREKAVVAQLARAN